jgi:phosphoglycerate kinase
MQAKKGEVVLLRLDFNVPINEQGKIIETFRIDESIPTIEQLQKKGAKVVVLAHRESGSLEPVAKYLKKKIKMFSFIKEVVGTEVKNRMEKIQRGEVLLVENLRLDDREKKNDIGMANFFATLADVYVNDAFSASHRTHTSIVALPQVMKKMKKKVFLGTLFKRELAKLEKALKPKHPFLFLLGGAKFDTKLALLAKYQKVADNIFVGGALAHSFFDSWGYEIGTSLLDKETKLTTQIADAENILLPVDVVVKNEVDQVSTKLSDAVAPYERIVDFGPNTLTIIQELAKNAKTIVWNGPMGWYEKGFDKGTKELLITLGRLKGKVVILGGGDTVTVANKLLKNKKYSNLKFTHISTGGGAMIDYLATGTLPGIKAILN